MSWNTYTFLYGDIKSMCVFTRACMCVGRISKLKYFYNQL